MPFALAGGGVWKVANASWRKRLNKCLSQTTGAEDDDDAAAAASSAASFSFPPWRVGRALAYWEEDRQEEFDEINSKTFRCTPKTLL